MTNTAPMPTQRSPEKLMATQRMELPVTRASDVPMQMAAALARVAEAAARFATNEARVCVRTLLVAWNVGALDLGRRYVEAYAERVAFIGEPASEVQAALRADLALAYRRMSVEQRRQLDALLGELRRTHPKMWLSQPFVR